jgi:hypothetical protein
MHSVVQIKPGRHHRSGNTLIVVADPPYAPEKNGADHSKSRKRKHGMHCGFTEAAPAVNEIPGASGENTELLDIGPSLSY